MVSWLLRIARKSKQADARRLETYFPAFFDYTV